MLLTADLYLDQLILREELFCDQSLLLTQERPYFNFVQLFLSLVDTVKN